MYTVKENKRMKTRELRSELLNSFSWYGRDKVFITGDEVAYKKFKHFKFQLQELVHTVTHLYYEDLEYTVNGYSYEYIAEYGKDLYAHMVEDGVADAMEELRAKSVFEIAGEFIDYIHDGCIGSNYTLDTAKAAFFDMYSEEAFHEVLLTLVSVRNFLNEYFYHIDMFDLDGTGGIDVDRLKNENKVKRFMRSDYIIPDWASLMEDYQIVSLL